MNLLPFVLKALAEGEAYGLQVEQRVAKLKGWGPARMVLFGPAVYGHLRLLEERGLASTRAVPDISGGRHGRHRLFYKLTDAGVAAARGERN